MKFKKTGLRNKCDITTNKLILLLFLMFLISSLNSCSSHITISTNKNSQYYNKMGKKAIRKGQFKEAVEHFTNAIDLNPNIKNIYYLRGLSYLNLKEFVKAEKDFRKALDADPNNGDILNSFALTCLFNGKLEEALKYSNKSLKFDEWQNGLNYNTRGLIYLELNKFDKAEKDFKKAISLNNKLTMYYSNLARTYNLTNDFDDAIEVLDKAIANDPGYGNAYYRKGISLIGLGKPQSALKNFNKALSINPNDNTIFRGIGEYYLSINTPEKAITECNKAISNNSTYSNAYYTRSKAYKIQKKYNKALIDLDKAIELQPSRFYLYQERGITNYESAKYDLAIKDHKKSLELYPENFIAYYFLGECYNKLNERSEAKKNYSKFISISSKKNSNKYQKAIDKAEKFIESN